MNRNDLHYARITDIAGLLERRELSPVELTRHMLERISVLDSQLNSYQTVMAEQAMDAAEKAIKIESLNLKKTAEDVGAKLHEEKECADNDQDVG